MATWHKQLEEAALEGADLGASSGNVSASVPPPSTGSIGASPAMSREAFASAAIVLDIAFARARSELGYIVELGHAHRGIPASGSLQGDNIWIRLGSATLRLVYSRRARVLVVSAPGKPDEQIRWSASERSLTGNDGKRIDLASYLDTLLETTIRAWKAGPLSERLRETTAGDRAPMPTLADEPENVSDRKETKAR